MQYGEGGKDFLAAKQSAAPVPSIFYCAARLSATESPIIRIAVDPRQNRFSYNARGRVAAVRALPRKKRISSDRV